MVASPPGPDSMFHRLLKPEYCFRPNQLLRRLLHSTRTIPEFVLARQPWGLEIGANPREGVGRHLWDLGIVDLPLSELVWRLLDARENGVDAGANIGAVTGLMAAKTGREGTVWAFEPHPSVHRHLAANVERWRSCGRSLGTIVVSNEALSDSDGFAELFESEEFEANQGSGSLKRPEANPRRSHRISTNTLDQALPRGACVGVLKIDVEGYEASVLRGCSRLLAEGGIRDIAYEDLHRYPSESSRLLEQAGYQVFSINRTFWRPTLEHPGNATPSVSWLPPNYLATIAPDRALARCQPAGWQCLRGAGLPR